MNLFGFHRTCPFIHNPPMPHLTRNPPAFCGKTRTRADLPRRVVFDSSPHRPAAYRKHVVAPIFALRTTRLTDTAGNQLSCHQRRAQSAPGSLLISARRNRRRCVRRDGRSAWRTSPSRSDATPRRARDVLRPAPHHRGAESSTCTNGRTPPGGAANPHILRTFPPACGPKRRAMTGFAPTNPLWHDPQANGGITPTKSVSGRRGRAMPLFFREGRRRPHRSGLLPVRERAAARWRRRA